MMHSFSKWTENEAGVQCFGYNMLMRLSEQRKPTLTSLPVGAQQPGLELRHHRTGALQITEFKERIVCLSCMIKRLVLADFNTLHPYLLLERVPFMFINNPGDLKWLFTQVIHFCACQLEEVKFKPFKGYFIQKRVSPYYTWPVLIIEVIQAWGVQSHLPGMLSETCKFVCKKPHSYKQDW